jgi:ferrous iron transport protein B
MALRVLEGDSGSVGLSENEAKGIAIHIDQLATERYGIINQLIEKVIKRGNGKGFQHTDSVDQLVLHPILGLPIFGMIMWTMFYLTFTIGGFFAEYIDIFFSGLLSDWVSIALGTLGVSPWLESMVVNGVIGGVGGVLTFVPNIAIVFILISFLEDTGYMARAAYLMDHWMSKVGLNGRSFIPMVLGFGCNVPGIMSTRTIESEKDRMIAILINPFMSCAARFPVYVLFASVFFPGKETLVTFSLYMLGIMMAFVFASVFRKFFFAGEQTPLILEIPPYRLPLIQDLGIHVWEKVRGYLVKAGTVIFGASVVLWFILNFNAQGMTEIGTSFGATIGHFLAPVFTPLGFGSWQNALSLLSGIVAKEIVVANTAILYGLSEAAGLTEFAPVLINEFSAIGAYAFMVFVLLYTPCVGVIGVIRRETNSWGWTAFSVTYQLIVAWTAAMLVFQIGSRLMT